MILSNNGRARDTSAIIFSLLGWIMAASLIPEIFTASYIDRTLFWISLPNGGSVGMGMLIDPLSIILANIVSFLGFIILVYSYRYMADKPGQTRYWFLMSLFISSMLLLVLADNLILFFIGWKIVGFCSYALIGHYYSDERKYWIGGPPPYSFQKPSRCGLKALLITTLGDVSLLAGIIILYNYSGTFNLMRLYQTAGSWLGVMAATPGMLALTSILILIGPIAKSAQFPFHEWLPEAMAGPSPVSALIHAATMVKAGVYFVARILPIFFYAYWIGGYSEARIFFIFIASIGAFTALLTGTQAMVSLELKKALAYSTMSQIGYMMLALGVAGLNVNSLVHGVSAGIFHLISHGIFKAALFLCAGVLIHTSGSIYLTKMNFSRRTMRYTWLFMWIVSASLIGIPPFSGFWSKDEVLTSCLLSGEYVLFTIALVTVAITCFYTIRFMGMIFHAGEGERKGEEAGILTLTTYGVLAALTVTIGLLGPWIGNGLYGVFGRYFTASLNLINVEGGYAANIYQQDPLHLLLPASSILMILIGGFPAYKLYISHGLQPADIISRYGILRRIHSFLWNRWYIDPFYNRVFVKGFLSTRTPLLKFVERPVDYSLNVEFPRFFVAASTCLRKVQTGILSINMIYVILFLLLIFILLWWGVL